MGKLAAVTCETSKPNKDRDRLLGDGDGLFLRIRPNGTKTWVVEFEFKGKRRKYTIGLYVRDGALGTSIGEWLRHSRLSLTQARAIAGEWKAARRAGHDPVKEWEAQLAAEHSEEVAHNAALAAEADQPTVSDAVTQFMEKIINGKKTAAAFQYRFDRLTAIIGEKKIRDVTRQDVIAALETIAKGQRKGRTAKQLSGEVLTQAKRLWRFAKSREWITDSSLEALTRRDFGARPTKRDVTLRLDELAAVWRTLDDTAQCKTHPVTIAALKLLILTGQRESEVTDAEWPEFDLAAGLWKIPAGRTKSNRAHLVHLAPQAVSILVGMKQLNGKKRYVFESPLKPEQPIYGRSVNNALAILFNNGKLPNVTRCHVHDFRRTLITRLPDLGFEPFLGHKIANHVLSGVFAHYNHNSYEEKREEALKAWAARLETLVGATNVAQLHRAA